MLKLRWSLAAAVALLAFLTLGSSLAGAAPWRPEANLTVRVTATPGSVVVGANLTYTVTVRNWAHGGQGT